MRGVERTGFLFLSIPVLFLGGALMEDMIAKIVDMDKKARSLTNEVKQSKIDYERQVIQTKETIKNNFLEKAKERIKINEQAIQKKADEEIARIEEKNAAIIKSLDDTYSANKDKWVNELVLRVVG